MNQPAQVTATAKPATTVLDPTKRATVAAPAVATAFTIESFEDTNEDFKIKMLVYAVQGAGKTTLTGTAADVPEMCDILMLDFESGKMTIKDNPRITNRKAIDVIRIKNFRQLAKVHEFLKQHVRFRDDPTKEANLIALESKFKGIEVKKPKRYNTVIIDSLSELDTLCLYELLGVQTDADLETIFDSGEKGGPDTAEFKEYKQNNQMVQLVVRAYRDLDVNVILVCHAKWDQDEQKRMLYSPTLTGKLSKQVQGLVDIVGYLVVGALPPADSKGNQPDAPRRLWVQPAGKFDAKCRIASFKGSYIDDPYMADVYEALNEKETNKK